MSPIRLAPLLLVVALCVGGCSDLGPAGGDLRAEVAEHRRIWESSRPSRYVYVVERLCFCMEEVRGPVRVWVAGPSVEARAYEDGGLSVPDEWSHLFPGVDGLFDVLEAALDEGAHQVQVTWDPVSGAPLDFWIDYNAQMADEEQGYRIVVLPTPLS